MELPLRPSIHSASIVAQPARAATRSAPQAEHVDAGAPARSSARDPYIDSLRALAIVRVIVYHALGWPWLVIVFPSVPIMLALAGGLMAASLDRSSGRRVIRSRIRRLLPPLWGLAAVAVPLMFYMGWTTPDGGPLVGLEYVDLVYWLIPLGDPPMSEWGDQLGSPLWYLRAYLWLVLLSPFLLWNFRRWPLATACAPLVLLLLIEGPVDSSGLAEQVLWGVGSFGTCWVIGFAAHDRLLDRVPAPVAIGLAAVLAALGLAWALAHPDPDDPVLFAEPLGDALWATAIVLLLMRFPISMDWLSRVPLLARFIDGFNQRAVTIYIWHLPCIFLADILLGTDGGYESLMVGVGLTTLVVIALGWIEDLAARRRPTMLPGHS